MDFSIPEEIRMMQDTVRKFVQRTWSPSPERWRKKRILPEEIVAKMRDLGLFGLAIPEEYGGLGLSTLGEIVVYEEITKTNACFRSRIGTSNGIGSQDLFRRHRGAKAKISAPHRHWRMDRGLRPL